jgi:hypothetical protein
MATLADRPSSRRPLDRLLERASAPDDAFELELRGPLDTSRHFICPTATPLFYAPVYQKLSVSARLRYNQLTAISFNEVIAYFESTFAVSVLSALAGGALQRDDQELARGLAQFVAEEQKHTEWWRQLGRLSVADDAPPLFRVPAATRSLLRWATRRPQLLPAVFWVMLALEERSIDISRRCLRADPATIEPNYRETYRRHLEHEVGHVYLDRQLIERYYAGRNRATRRLNARLLRGAIATFLLPPVRSAARVVQQLTRERPELAPLGGQMLAPLGGVGADPAYQAMMYSRESTPITFSLFDRFPEMHAIERVLSSYRPQPTADAS